MAGGVSGRRARRPRARPCCARSRTPHSVALAPRPQRAPASKMPWSPIGGDERERLQLARARAHRRQRILRRADQRERIVRAAEQPGGDRQRRGEVGRRCARGHVRERRERTQRERRGRARCGTAVGEHDRDRRRRRVGGEDPLGLAPGFGHAPRSLHLPRVVEHEHLRRLRRGRTAARLAQARTRAAPARAPAAASNSGSGGRRSPREPFASTSSICSHSSRLGTSRTT